MPADIDPESFGRALVALFQGFTLQVAWDEPVDIEAAVHVIEHMVFALFGKRAVAAKRRTEAP